MGDLFSMPRWLARLIAACFYVGAGTIVVGIASAAVFMAYVTYRGIAAILS